MYPNLRLRTAKLNPLGWLLGAGFADDVDLMVDSLAGEN
jgi:hypothetical protein